MKVGFAVSENQGLDSKVYDHFGSAPAFIIVDTECNEVTVVENKDAHHAHGACNPLLALDGRDVDAVVVGGIGAGALTKLNAAGIRVYRSKGRTIHENLELFGQGRLEELSVYSSCRGHDRGCGH